MRAADTHGYPHWGVFDIDGPSIGKFEFLDDLKNLSRGQLETLIRDMDVLERRRYIGNLGEGDVDCFVVGNLVCDPETAVYATVEFREDNVDALDHELGTIEVGYLGGAATGVMRWMKLTDERTWQYAPDLVDVNKHLLLLQLRVELKLDDDSHSLDNYDM